MANGNSEPNISETGNKAIKAGFWYTVSNVGTKALMIITTPLFTRLMTQEEYGVAATFTSWFALLSCFASLNMMYSIGRAKIDFKNQLNQYVGSLYCLSAIVMLVVSSVMVVFREKLGTMMELTPALVVLLAIYLLCYPAIDLKQALFKYQYKYKGNILITVFTTVSMICVTFPLLLSMDSDRFYARVLGAVLPTLILALFIWGKALTKKEMHISATYWKYALTISLPLLLNTVSLHVMAQSDRIVITKFGGTAKTAIYTLAYQFAVMINIILDAINNAWLPWFHDSYEAENYIAIKKNTRTFLNFGCLVGIGFISLAPEAIYILGGTDYMEGQYVVYPLIMGILCRFMFVQFEHIELHLKKTKYTAFGTVIAAIINVCLNIYFVPIYGFIAAAYTTLASYLCLMLIHYLVTRFILKVKLFDTIHMCVLLFFTALVGFGLTQLYHSLLLRILADALLIALFMLYYRKMIISYIKRKR